MVLGLQSVGKGRGAWPETFCASRQASLRDACRFGTRTHGLKPMATGIAPLRGAAAGFEDDPPSSDFGATRDEDERGLIIQDFSNGAGVTILAVHFLGVPVGAR